MSQNNNQKKIKEKYPWVNKKIEKFEYCEQKLNIMHNINNSEKIFCHFLKEKLTD